MDEAERKAAEVVEPELVSEKPVEEKEAAKTQGEEGPAYSRGTVIAAFSVAIASDVIAAPLSFFPFLLPLEIGIDIVTAVLLTIIFKGFDLLLILTLVLELPPFISSLPWWTIIVFAKCKGLKIDGVFKLLSRGGPKKPS